MNTPNQDSSPMLNVTEAASYLRLGISTLNKMRVNGGGPAFLKLGGRRVVYDIKDLDDWRATRRRLSTSQQ